MFLFVKNKKKKKMNLKGNKNYILTIVLILMFVFFSFTKTVKNNNFITLSDFINLTKLKQIEKADVLINTVIGETKDGVKFKTFFPEIYIGRIIDLLTQENISYDFLSIDGQKTLLDRFVGLFFGLISWLPILLITLWFIWPMLLMKKKKKKTKI